MKTLTKDDYRSLATAWLDKHTLPDIPLIVLGRINALAYEFQKVVEAERARCEAVLRQRVEGHQQCVNIAKGNPSPADFYSCRLDEAQSCLKAIGES